MEPLTSRSVDTLGIILSDCLPSGRERSEIPVRCILAGARALNAEVEPSVLHRAGEGQPDAEEIVARAVLAGVADEVQAGHLYGCAKRGCDTVNPDYLAFGGPRGKSYCLHHIPLRSQLRCSWQEWRSR